MTFYNKITLCYTADDLRALPVPDQGPGGNIMRSGGSEKCAGPACWADEVGAGWKGSGEQQAAKARAPSYAAAALVSNSQGPAAEPGAPPQTSPQSRTAFAATAPACRRGLRLLPVMPHGVGGVGAARADRQVEGLGCYEACQVLVHYLSVRH